MSYASACLVFCFCRSLLKIQGTFHLSVWLFSFWAALHITTQIFRLAANYNIPMSPCLCSGRLILGKQMVIVIVIVMWERHLCAGMLLRWKSSKSVRLCWLMSISSSISADRSPKEDIMEFVVIGGGVTQFLKAITLCSSCCAVFIRNRCQTNYLQCWGFALFSHTRVLV